MQKDFVFENEFRERCQKHGIETNVAKRWESKTPHHLKSVTIMSMIVAADCLYRGDGDRWSIGEGCNNGEYLLYLLDIGFDLEDAEFKLNPLIRKYHEIAEELRAYKAQTFPSRMSVRVACPQYTGKGTVVLDDGCPPEKLAVLLGNGSIWWYPIEACTPLQEPIVLP